MDSLEALEYFVALCALRLDREGAKRVLIIKKDLEEYHKIKKGDINK